MKHLLMLLLLLILLVAVKFCNAQTFTLFGAGTPGNDVTVNYGAPTDFGFKFRTSTMGWILGVKFYKTSSNTGTHIGEIYSPMGTRLEQVTFVNETSSGWQTAMFSTPIQIDAITFGSNFYIASYYSPQGNVASSSNQFNNAIVNGFLNAPANNPLAFQFTAQYSQTNTPSLPNNGSSAGFWVDVIFSTVLPLPVTYLYFDATKKNLNAELKWATTSEENNSGFKIERSVDGLDWSILSFVAGVGNSQTEVDYNYVDLNLNGGTYYYRLIQVDLDGRETFSKIDAVTIDVSPVLEMLQNYPNPFNNTTTVQINIPKPCHVQLFIYDNMGRMVKSLIDEERMAGNYDVQVNKNGLMAGIYYCKLSALSQSLVRKLEVY